VPRFASSTGSRALLRCVLGIAFAAFVDAASGDGVTDDEVEQAIAKAVKFLWDKQKSDGSWSEGGYENQYPGGLTALAGFALRTAGEGVSEPGMQRAIEHLESVYKKEQIETVYARSFALMFWCSLDPAKYRRQIRSDVSYLSQQQAGHGAWGYGRDPDAPGGWTDHSNSQLAVLALWEAADAGGEVSNRVWERAAKSWLETQNPDGGWGYPASPRAVVGGTGVDASYGSMTAAGLATMYILYDQLYAGAEGVYKEGVARNCGVSSARVRPVERSIERAWEWINKHFTVAGIPPVNSPMSRPQWMTYYLYSIERAGVASGFKYFGEQPWYRSVATQLVRTQGFDGSWGQPSASVFQTSLGLLALCKGRAAIAFNKLKYETAPGEEDDGRSRRNSPAEDWNNDPRDVATLTHWLSRRYETGLTWQTVELRADRDGLRDAPILYLTGHLGPVWTGVQKEVLRDYVLSGGTLVAVACCNRQEFVTRVIGQLDDTFPRLRRETLPSDHPVWTIHDKLTPNGDIVGYHDGCRTSVFIIKKGVCCAWQQNLVGTEAADFHLASSILLYATNKAKLRKKLAPLFAEARTLFGGKRLRVGRVRHDGDFWADPLALKRLSDALVKRAELGIDEVADVDLASAALDELDALLITGHTEFALSGAQRDALRKYIESGGTLLAAAACGRAAFDASLRKLIADAFPAGGLVPIPADDDLYRASGSGGGFDLRQVKYRRTPAGRKFDPTPAPQLLGLKLAGRWAVIYSPLDLTCAWVGHECFDCVGYEPDDARAIGVNGLLYARSQRMTGPSGK